MKASAEQDRHWKERSRAHLILRMLFSRIVVDFSHFRHAHYIETLGEYGTLYFHWTPITLAQEIAFSTDRVASLEKELCT